MNSAGQMSTEFIISLVVFLLILSVACAIYFDISTTTLDRVKYLKIKNTADQLASAINGLATKMDGNTSTYFVLDRSDYLISVSENSLWVRIEDVSAFSHLNTDPQLNFNSTYLHLTLENGVVHVEDG